MKILKLLFFRMNKNAYFRNHKPSLFSLTIMRECFRCHAMISDKAQFCPVCGSQQPTSPHGSYQPTQTQDAHPQNSQYGGPPAARGQKSNGWVWALVAFLAAAVLGVGGWLVYDKLIRADDAPVFVPADGNLGNEKKTADDTKARKTKADQDKKSDADKKTGKDRQEKKEGASDEPERPSKTTAQPSGPYSMTGSVDKYPITMSISITDGDVYGTYYYHSQGSGKRMTLTGTISADRRMYLEEYAPDGINTGYFEGSFDGSTYAGHFSNYEKDSHLYFSLKTQ